VTAEATAVLGAVAAAAWAQLRKDGRVAAAAAALGAGSLAIVALHERARRQVTTWKYEVTTRQRFSWAISPVPEVHCKSHQAPNSTGRTMASQVVQSKVAAVHAVDGVTPSGTCFQFGSLA